MLYDMSAWLLNTWLNMPTISAALRWRAKRFAHYPAQLKAEINKQLPGNLITACLYDTNMARLEGLQITSM